MRFCQTSEIDGEFVPLMVTKISASAAILHAVRKQHFGKDLARIGQARSLTLTRGHRTMLPLRANPLQSSCVEICLGDGPMKVPAPNFSSPLKPLIRIPKRSTHEVSVVRYRDLRLFRV